VHPCFLYIAPPDTTWTKITIIPCTIFMLSSQDVLFSKVNYLSCDQIT
jgi:hypothetical protein